MTYLNDAVERVMWVLALVCTMALLALAFHYAGLLSNRPDTDTTVATSNSG